MANQQRPSQAATVPEERSLKWWLIGGGVIVVLLAVVAYFFLYIPAADETTTNTTELPTVQNIDLPNTYVQAPDKDRDRLTDSDELTLGTNPAKADSDDDGLNDYSELNIYNTDPLNADSDGDGHPDGKEVDDGFDPAGPGEILNVNSALTNQAGN
jgi:hypothetical protein